VIVMKRHPFDPISFVSGALFLALGLLVFAGEAARVLSGTWLAPAAIIALGLLLLVAGWRSSRSSDDAPA
jgi:hypothetical protein